MQFLVYIIIYPFILALSLLPFRALYIVSDFVFILVYHIFGYRKKVVRENLALALPNYSESERLEIEKKSYKHLCDMFLETIKTMTISQKEIDERFVFKNLDVYLDLEKKNKSIALMCAHYASYEWVVSINKKINFKGYAIYKKINNKYFDDLIKKIRSRFEVNLIHNRESIAVIEENERNNLKCLYGFASDQSPMLKPSVYWGSFMGINIPIHTGAELLSKRLDMNIIYLKVTKVGRGFYEAEFEVLSENVKAVPDYEITDAFIRKVEQQIYEQPEFYLWTHKRWKHKK